MTIKDLNESYSLLDFSDETDDNQIIQRKLAIMEALSVFVDGHEFTPRFRAGVWDGKKEFYKIHPDGLLIYKGLVQSVIKKFGSFLSKEYIPISGIEKISPDTLQEHINSLELPFEPRDYQFDAVYRTINEPRKILKSATGSGKSLIIYILMTYFKSINKKGILIVPNVGLVEQMLGDFKDYNMKNHNDVHIIYSGKPKNFDKPITITTWQSAIKIKAKEFEQLDYVIIDECHLATGESLQYLLNISHNCIYKIGLTGTLPKNYIDRFTLAATLGKTDNIITAQGLVEKGYATPVEIILMYMNYSDEEKRVVKKLKYQQETKYLEEHYIRNDYIARLSIQVTKTYGNTLLMYNSIKHGEFLLELVLKNKFNIDNVALLDKVTPKRLEKIDYENTDKIFTISELNDKEIKNVIKVYGSYNPDKFDNLEKYHIFLIRGSVEGKDRDKIRKILETLDDALLISNYQTTSTGMNIKRLNNMILGIGTKSNIRLGQSIGRGMRLHGEKDKFRLFDIIDDFSKKTKTGKIWNKNYALKHSYERLEEYFEYGYPLIEKEINLTQN